MIIKGIVSAIKGEKVEVILPEYDNAVTRALPVYGGLKSGELNVSDFVLVMPFNDDFNDAIVLKKTASSSGTSGFAAYYDASKTALVLISLDDSVTYDGSRSALVFK